MENEKKVPDTPPGLVEPVGLKGYVQLQLFDGEGKVKQESEGDNLVVTTGKAFLASALRALTATKFDYMAIGTSSTATALGQTALQGSELARVASVNTNPTSVTTQFVATYGAGVGTGTVEEIGLFTAAVAGTMFSRYLTGTYVKDAADTLVITWTITVT